MENSVEKLNKKTHWITAGVVFLISFLGYMRTVAPTTSFWDCGEFIACSKILGVMHPPGAPLYLLIGRIMTMLPIVEDIGLRVNIFSVLISALAVFFTYLVVVQLICRWRGQPATWEDRLIAYGSAAVGAVAFAFTDSQWFNAVEAEVYAFSMFFTVIVIWLALHWGERSEEAGSISLIILIFYIFGLAIGVHLLNILAFPVILLIAYFHHNTTVRRLLMLLFIQAALPITIYVLGWQFDPMKMTYHQILEHQAGAQNFLKWGGSIWVVITMIYMWNKDKKVFKIWWIVPALVVLGYSTYLIIFLRAKLGPPINENDPSTFQGMMDYLARKQYGNEDLLLTFMHRKAEFWQYQIQKMYTRYFGWQFIGKGDLFDRRDFIIQIISFKGLWGLPLFVGLWGAIHHFFKDWKRALAVAVLFLLTGYAIILYLNQPNPQPRERDYSYVGSFFAFALWIGIGMAGMLETISEFLKDKTRLRWIAQAAVSILLIVIVPLNLFAFNFESHDRSGNYVASDYSYNMLQTLEEDALIFTNGDNDTFPLWYLQEVEGVRKDVRVVNLSLLNTAWYIKQLRDMEPKVPITLSDATIDNLTPQPWETKHMAIPVPESVQNELKEELGPGKADLVQDKIRFSVKPTIGSEKNGGLRVADMMVMHLLQKARWKRPVYFAVTVANENWVGLEKFFRMDGLAFKIMPYEVDEIDPEVLRENLLEKYRYRNLNNPDVFYNRTITRLMGNYRSAFMQLASYYKANDQNEKAIEILNEMNRILPPENIPFHSERTALAIGDLYKRTGGDMDINDLLEHIIGGRTVGDGEKLTLAQYHASFFQNYDRAEQLAMEVLKRNTRSVKAYQILLHIYRQTSQYDKAISIMEDWLVYVNPNDPQAQAELDSLRVMAAKDTTGDMTLDILE